MCHLILLMPVLGLTLFWFLPIGYALPSYIAIVLLSAFLFWLITRAMRRPIQDGFQSLIGTDAEVVSRSEAEHSTKYLIRAQGEGELWSAYSEDTLKPGDLVNIVALKGIGVVVERAENDSHSSSNVKTDLPGDKESRQRCH